MKLIQVIIKNFRKFKKETTIPLTRSHLILGANDSGKSTIMKAINIALLDLIVDKSDIVDLNVETKITLNFWDKKNKSLITKKYNSKGTKSSTKSSILPEDFKKENLKKHIFIPSELIKAEDTALNVVINNNEEINKKIIELEKELKDEIEKLLNNNKIDIPLIIGDYTQFNAIVKIKPSAKIEVEKDHLQLSQKGEGYQKNIALSLLKKLKLDSSLILIDEIENHFSIPNVKSIISSIIKNNQAIFTSHRLEGKIGDISGICFLGKDEKDIAGAIDALKIEVNQYDKIILVEGKTDIYYINKFIEIQKAKEIEFNAIVVHIGGESQMVNVKNELKKVIDENKIVLIKDGDQSEKNEENVYYLNKEKIEDYRSDFDDIVKNYNKKIAKNIASMKLDFMKEKNNELVEELSSLLLNKDK